MNSWRSAPLLGCSLAAALALFLPFSPGLRAAGELSTPLPHAVLGAEHYLMQGRADDAIVALRSTLSTNPANGEAHLLLCRVYVSEQMAGPAVSECQAALADGLANSSAAQDWTGRALGLEAEHAGVIAAVKLALQVRTAFETAVRLDPDSEAACIDLGEYYTGAPAVMGGGTARALALASRIDRALPQTADRIRAMAAERDKDYGTAEHEFQAAVAVAHAPGALVDLAAFYARRDAYAKALEAVRQTLATDRELDATVVEAASLLDDLHQTGTAEQVMLSYLQHGDRSDRAPTFRVYTLLGGMMARSGDKTAARVDFDHALALASQYAPAKKGLGAL